MGRQGRWKPRILHDSYTNVFVSTPECIKPSFLGVHKTQSNACETFKAVGLSIEVKKVYPSKKTASLLPQIRGNATLEA